MKNLLYKVLLGISWVIDVSSDCMARITSRDET